jgi:hypothetical protein
LYAADPWKFRYVCGLWKTHCTEGFMDPVFLSLFRLISEGLRAPAFVCATTRGPCESGITRWAREGLTTWAKAVPGEASDGHLSASAKALRHRHTRVREHQARQRELSPARWPRRIAATPEHPPIPTRFAPHTAEGSAPPAPVPRKRCRSPFVCREMHT